MNIIVLYSKDESIKWLVSQFTWVKTWLISIMHCLITSSGLLALFPQIPFVIPSDVNIKSQRNVWFICIFTWKFICINILFSVSGSYSNQHNRQCFLVGSNWGITSGCPPTSDLQTAPLFSHRTINWTFHSWVILLVHIVFACCFVKHWHTVVWEMTGDGIAEITE